MAGSYHGTPRKSTKPKKPKTYRGKPRRPSSHLLAAAKRDPWKHQGQAKSGV